MKNIKQALIRHLYATIEQAEMGRLLVNGEELDTITQAETEHLWKQIKDGVLIPLGNQFDDFVGDDCIEFD